MTTVFENLDEAFMVLVGQEVTTANLVTLDALVHDPVPFPEHAYPLLRKALEHIASHPDEFYMRSWIIMGERVADYEIEMKEVVSKTTGMPFPACGTAACLAGHIRLASGAPALDIWESSRIDRDALDDLGITYDSAAGRALDDMFDRTEITTYAELRQALSEAFIFPEPLPVEPV